MRVVSHTASSISAWALEKNAIEIYSTFTEAEFLEMIEE